MATNGKLTEQDPLLLFQVSEIYRAFPDDLESQRDIVARFHDVLNGNGGAAVPVYEAKPERIKAVAAKLWEKARDYARTLTLDEAEDLQRTLKGERLAQPSDDLTDLVADLPGCFEPNPKKSFLRYVEC